MPWCHMWCWCCQGLPAFLLSDEQWWGQLCATWLHQG
ncbi:hypothetical protein CsSME_00045001 [Camellia sinensis var. sinensis]